MQPPKENLGNYQPLSVYEKQDCQKTSHEAIILKFSIILAYIVNQHSTSIEKDHGDMSNIITPPVQNVEVIH